ncbi:MAG: gamma-glutamyltransferase [bacterium]|nr:gamma-glutamyltransferase [bacterium]
MPSTFEEVAVVGQPEADSAAVNVLKKGGNAVDAAVAAALLSCVLMPHHTGIGGYGGMMVVCINGKVSCVDFNTVAPQAATSKMFQVVRSDGRFGSLVKDRANETGPLAISVPGVLAGLSLATETYGKLPLADLLAPAIRACKNGFRVPAAYAEAVAAHEKRVRAFPETAKLFLVDDALPTTKDRAANPNLGKLLEQVAQKGAEEFYKGKIADQIVSYIQESGGILTKEDMETYEARVVEPAQAACMGYDLYSAPLCSSGPSLLQMCRIAEVAELDMWARDAARLAHGMAETIRAAWLDRYRHFGDPRFVDVPLNMLTSDVNIGATGREIAGHIAEGTRGQSLLRPLYSGGTTHISVVDRDRNMVSLTLTHGPAYGSCVTIPKTGLLMNAGMSRFDPGSGLSNSVGPGKAPVVNMCPTLILQDGRPSMTLGASGGTRIPSSLFHVLSRRLVLGEDLDWAVGAPRVHSEGNEWVMLEEEFGELAPEYLKSIGYTLKKGRAAAHVRAIEVGEDGTLLACLDPRLRGKEKGI